MTGLDSDSDSSIDQHEAIHEAEVAPGLHEASGVQSTAMADESMGGIDAYDSHDIDDSSESDDTDGNDSDVEGLPGWLTDEVLQQLGALNLPTEQLHVVLGVMKAAAENAVAAVNAESGLPAWLFADVDDDEDSGEDYDSDDSSDHSPGPLHPNDTGIFGSKADWYRDNCHDYVTVGSKLTILGACFTLLCWKRGHHVRDTAFDAILGIISQYLLPTVEGRPPHLPPSFYVLKNMIRVASHTHYMWHVCQNGCSSWAPLHPRHYKAAENDRCAHCNHARFKTARFGGKPQLQPCKVMCRREGGREGGCPCMSGRC